MSLTFGKQMTLEGRHQGNTEYVILQARATQQRTHQQPDKQNAISLFKFIKTYDTPGHASRIDSLSIQYVVHPRSATDTS